MNVLITGCPRSGTKYAYKFYNLNGIRIGHEKLGLHGISSWCLATGGNSSLYGPSYKEVTNKFKQYKVYHQVREPLACISSLQTISQKAYNYIINKISIESVINKLEGLMYIWLKWNIFAEQISTERYQLEKIHEKFPYYSPYSNIKCNTRKHDSLTLKQLKEVNPILTSKILNKARHYGYQY